MHRVNHIHWLCCHRRFGRCNRPVNASVRWCPNILMRRQDCKLAPVNQSIDQSSIALVQHLYGISELSTVLIPGPVQGTNTRALPHLSRRPRPGRFRV